MLSTYFATFFFLGGGRISGYFSLRFHVKQCYLWSVIFFDNKKVQVRRTSVYRHNFTKALFWSKPRPAFFINERTLTTNGTVVLSVLSVTVVTYRGQTVGRIKMPLGTEVGLGPGDIVLDGNTAPPTGTISATAEHLYGLSHVRCG